MKIIIFMFIGIFALFAIPFGLYQLKENKSEWWFVLSVIGTVCFATSIVLTGGFIEQKRPIPVKSSKFNIKTEVQVNTINGQETSRDTVYIFTPKKK